jgi:hypothetical protein
VTTIQYQQIVVERVVGCLWDSEVLISIWHFGINWRLIKFWKKKKKTLPRCKLPSTLLPGCSRAKRNFLLRTLFFNSTSMSFQWSGDHSLDFPCHPSTTFLSDLHPTASSCRHVFSRYNILSKFRATVADRSLDDDGRLNRFGGPIRTGIFGTYPIFSVNKSERTDSADFRFFVFKTAVYWNWKLARPNRVGCIQVSNKTPPVQHLLHMTLVESTHNWYIYQESSALQEMKRAGDHEHGRWRITFLKV